MTSLISSADDLQKTSWFSLMAVLTLLAAGTGGLSGAYFVSKVETKLDEKRRLEVKAPDGSVAFDETVGLTSLGAIVTNLAGPGNLWIRLEASIVLTKGSLTNPDVAIGEVRQDLLAYLRTLTVSQIEGPSGLLHLREDLTERVRLRTEGKVHDFFIETLVVQ